MHSWDPLLPWFSMSEKSSPFGGGVPTPATIFPSFREDHVNNHISLGVPPLNTDPRTLCQVEVTPHKSEGIEPFTLVNSPPGQVEVSSSHPINTLSGQVGVTPCKSEGIEPFTLVNSLPGQVEVYPCTRSTLHRVKSGSPPANQKVSSPSPQSTLRHVKLGSPLAIQEVSSPPPWSTLPGQVGAVPSHQSTLRQVITRSHPWFPLK